MSRWSFTLVAFAALTACKQPKGVEVDPRQLIPADATFALGFEVGPLRGSPIGSAIHTLMQTDSDMRGMIEAVRGCEIDLDNLRGFLAGDPAREDRFVVVLEGAKVGDTDNVRCFEKEFAKATGGKDGRLLFKTRGELQTLDQEGGGKLIVLNSNALVFANAEWEDVVFAAIEKPETRNTTSPLAKLVATVDPSSDVWLALAFGDADRTTWSGLEGGDGIQGVTAIVDLAHGVKLTANVDGRDVANAKVLEGSLRAVLEEAKPGLVDVGMPANLLDTLKVSSAEGRVTATVEIADDAVPGLVTAVASLAAAG